jgi:hypothetical protein
MSSSTDYDIKRVLDRRRARRGCVESPTRVTASDRPSPTLSKSPRQSCFCTFDSISFMPNKVCASRVEFGKHDQTTRPQPEHAIRRSFCHCLHRRRQTLKITLNSLSPSATTFDYGFALVGECPILPGPSFFQNASPVM